MASWASLPCRFSRARKPRFPPGASSRSTRIRPAAGATFFLGRATAAAPSGDFVAVWTSDPQDGSGAGVFGQRFDSAGVARGSEFRANTHTTGAQMSPTVAVGARGDFVVAWQSAAQDGNGEGIFAQRYAATGQTMGGEFLVNSVTAGNQRLPAAAVDGAGNFTIVWSGGVANEDVFGQRFDATGSRRGAEFRLNTYTTGAQGMPSVDVDGAGNAVVAWESFGQVSLSPEVFGATRRRIGQPAGRRVPGQQPRLGYRARVSGRRGRRLRRRVERAPEPSTVSSGAASTPRGRRWGRRSR